MSPNPTPTIGRQTREDLAEGLIAGVAIAAAGGVGGPFVYIHFDGTTVKTATFTVDMTTVSSDQQRRDNQFNGRIMETATYPTATFTLTKPIVLASIPADGVTATATATGNLTLHGTTRSVTLKLTGVRNSGAIRVTSSIPVVFADYNISNPSFSPVTTDGHGSLEFLLTLSHA